jgi:hypothetical protein
MSKLDRQAIVGNTRRLQKIQRRLEMNSSFVLVLAFPVILKEPWSAAAERIWVNSSHGPDSVCGSNPDPSVATAPSG